MDNQFFRDLKVPKDKTVSSYYIVDNDLRYVSLHENGIYILSYVDNSKTGEKILMSQNEYDFDYFVIKNHEPLYSMTCDIKYDIRYVELKTCSGNFKYKKARKPKEDTVLSKYTNKHQNKLF